MRREEMLDHDKPEPTLSRKDEGVKFKPSSSHWYADQSPSSRWADEVEEEEKSRGRSFMDERPRYNANLDQEGDESFIRGAHRDPFLQVLDKLANRMDRPARPAPPAWPVFTDKYQDFPKWRKDISSYLNDYCSSLKQETKVLHLKEKCFSKKTVILLESFETLDSIFRRLEQIYKQPACYAVEAMKPFLNQKLKADNDAVGLEMAYQTNFRVLRETKKLDQVRSLSGPEYVWRMTATLSQLELGLWKGFK